MAEQGMESQTTKKPRKLNKTRNTIASESKEFKKKK